jgi:hypothetical protein
VNEPVVEPGLLGQPARRDARVTDVHEQALGRVEEGLLRGRARGRLGYARFHSTLTG